MTTTTTAVHKQYLMKQNKQPSNPKTADKPSKKDDKQPAAASKSEASAANTSKPPPVEASVEDVIKSQLDKKVVISSNLKLLTANSLEKSLFTIATGLTHANEPGLVRNLVDTFKAASTSDSDLEAAHQSCLQVEDQLHEAILRGSLLIPSEAASLPTLIHQHLSE